MRSDGDFSKEDIGVSDMNTDTDSMLNIIKSINSDLTKGEIGQIFMHVAKQSEVNKDYITGDDLQFIHEGTLYNWDPDWGNKDDTKEAISDIIDNILNK